MIQVNTAVGYIVVAVFHENDLFLRILARVAGSWLLALLADQFTCVVVVVEEVAVTAFLALIFVVDSTI